MEEAIPVDLAEMWEREDQCSGDKDAFVSDYSSASESEADSHVSSSKAEQPGFLDSCSWGDSLSFSPRAVSFPSGSDTIIDELALTPPDDPTSEASTDSDDSTPGASRRGQKRSACSAATTKPNLKQPRTSAEESNGDVAVEIQWQTLLNLLADENYMPGARPDLIDSQSVRPNLMFKEQPKRRRPHSSPAHRRDKWYNTGGVKSASDRFDATSNLGMRKRYGKVVREGLPVLRFHEYTLLTRDPVTEEVTESPSGASLFHLVADTKRLKKADSRAMKSVVAQTKELQRMRAKEATLVRQLAEMQTEIKRQSVVLQRLRQDAQKELRQHGADPAAAGTPE